MVLALAAIIGLSAAPPAPSPEGLSPYALDPVPHGLITLGALGIVGIFQLVIEPELAGGLRCALPPGASRCPASALNELDRTVVGNNSSTWRAVSDVGATTTAVLAAAGLAIDAWAAGSAVPGSDFLADSLVVSEAAALATLATFVIKTAVQRPRPTHYTEGAPIGGFEQLLSFPSGHATTTTAIATAFAVTFGLRHPTSPWRFVVYAAAAAASLLISYARVGAGRHFYTDVLAGMGIGMVAGVAVPWLHRAATP